MLPYFDNQKILKEESELTLENIYQFLEYLWSEEISFHKKAIYCKFWDSNEITSNGFPRFFTIWKLIRDSFLLADMRNYACTFRSETNELREYMKSVEMKKDYRLLWLKKEYSTVYIFNGIGFSHFMSLVDFGDDFDMQISTSPFFIEHLLSFISNYQGIPDIDEAEALDHLYLDIDWYLAWKRNSSQEITLKYKLSNYAENKRNMFSILEDLQEKGNVRIKDIIIKELYISFILDSFTDFSRELFIAKNEKNREKEVIIEETTDSNSVIIPKEDEYYESLPQEIFSFRNDEEWIFLIENITGMKLELKKKNTWRFHILNLSFDKQYDKKVSLSKIVMAMNKSEREIADYDKKSQKSIYAAKDELNEDIESLFKIKKLFRVEKSALVRDK